MMSRADDAWNAAVRRVINRHADNVQHAGDAIGRNNSDLATECYQLASRLRQYADTIGQHGV